MRGQLARQDRRRNFPAPARILPGPQRREFAAAQALRFGAKRRDRRQGQRKGWSGRTDRTELTHDPVHDAASRPPGEWQTYDIIFEAPKFNGSVLVSPAYATVFWNGVIVHNRQKIAGPTSPTQTVHAYTKPHDP